MKPEAARTFGKASLPALILAFLPALAAVAFSVSDPLLQRLSHELQQNKMPTPELTEQLGQFLEKNPANYQAHLLMGNCYERLGLYDQALAELELATKYGPDDPAPISELIRQQMTLGRTKSTPSLLQQAQKRFPGDPGITFLSGNWLLSSSHDVPGAEKLFRSAAETGARVPGLNLSLAQIAMGKNEFEEAIKECDEELKIEPGAPEALLIKGMALAQSVQFAAALPPLKAVWALSEYKLRPGLARAYAQAAYWNGKFEEAIEPAILQLAIDGKKEDSAMENLLAQCLRRAPRANAQEAVAAATNSLDHNATIFKDGSFHRKVAQVLARVGMDRQAVEEYGACLRRNNDDGYALVGLAREFETNFPEYRFALALYQRVQRFHPEIINVDNAIARLEERIRDRETDLAWRLKDWLRGSCAQASTEFGALLAGSSEKPQRDDKLEKSKTPR